MAKCECSQGNKIIRRSFYCAPNGIYVAKNLIAFQRTAIPNENNNGRVFYRTSNEQVFSLAHSHFVLLCLRPKSNTPNQRNGARFNGLRMMIWKRKPTNSIVCFVFKYVVVDAFEFTQKNAYILILLWFFFFHSKWKKFFANILMGNVQDE